MKEILLIDKPVGIISFDVIRSLRRKLGITKMGHAGTLDPLASGLMVIGINSGTKKMNDFIGLDKVYCAEIRFGVRTTTGDLEGDVVESKDVDIRYIEKNINTTLKTMIGTQELFVPLYCAIKCNGKPLYWYARNNIPVVVPKKNMHIYSISNTLLMEHDGHVHLSLEIHVGSGAYIRSIAEEIGKRMKVPAVLSGLRRIRVGDFTIDDARTLESF